MKILCLIHYYPNPGANTICCENIAKYLKSKGHTVDFLSVKVDENDIPFEIIDGSMVIRADNTAYIFYEKYGVEFTKKDWTSLLWASISMTWLNEKVEKKLKPYTHSMLKSEVIKSKPYCRVLEEMNLHYDCILAYSGPFRMITLAKVLKERGFADNWYPIFLDSYVHGHLKAGLSIRRRVAEYVLRSATQVFMVDGILGENIKQNFHPEYENKTTEFYLPMLFKREDLKLRANDSKVVLVYAGSFYQGIRNPSKMLEILSNLPEQCYTRVFSRSNCRDIVNEKKQLFKPGRIYTSRQIPHEKCLEEVANSDILINLGNAVSNQMPCKIFEYISFGKPILNFYFIKEDMCLPILEKYPLGLNIDLSNYKEEQYEEIEKFVLENKGRKISYEEATANLDKYKIENNISKIEEILKKNLK